MPSPRLPSKVARLLAAQMVVVIGVLVVLWAFLLWGTRPNHPLQTHGGIDTTNVTITWIAFTVVLLALALIHYIFARQLFGEAKGVRRGVKSW
ncbi:hypothetical protein J421_2720 [Gemmatirosa kalamazoonensis]|jgi:hypothetical protein|uniref:DUF4405 domain-containing protein n=1 Tax=Gemmatirosa kalamazoonensis TaxID=861299 RepID=W0RIK8_9BACT|nr:hypothetical protein [Gemmatirosa kalamazoonensis]AHG90257.1 hypothetical protein J421_2720 [Gemmatirosa kalamazoonensis]